MKSSGISVTKEMSATTRMVLDSVRTLVIWGVSLAVGWQVLNVLFLFLNMGVKKYMSLGLRQEFHWLQLLGFVILVTGMCIYNDIVISETIDKD